MNNELLTKAELAKMLNTSTRTIDRWRQRFHLGEVRLTPTATPRFRRQVIEQALTEGKFLHKKRDTKA
jgi:transposase